MNYISFFQQEGSPNTVVPNATFKKPKNFEDRLADVQRRVDELNMRSRSAKQMVNP